MHRDVKSENMLLETNKTLKIADFGVARVEAQNPQDMTGETGTLGYMGPEVFVILHPFVFRNCENKYRKKGLSFWGGVVDRFLKERLTTGNAMCIVLVYASGKYTAATCPTLTLVLLRSLMPLFIGSLSLSFYNLSYS